MRSSRLNSSTSTARSRNGRPATSSRLSPEGYSGNGTRCVPFLKWPGGKRWAAAEIAALIQPHLEGTNYEPFLRGGAVFFHLRPPKAELSDVCDALVETYRVAKANP